MKSILQKDRKCWLCGTALDLHRHHVFYGSANRKKSDRYGLTVWLCSKHHNMSNDGVHFDPVFDAALKSWAQQRFEEKYSHEKFMAIFHKNYKKSVNGEVR